MSLPATGGTKHTGENENDMEDGRHWPTVHRSHIESF